MAGTAAGIAKARAALERKRAEERAKKGLPPLPPRVVMAEQPEQPDDDDDAPQKPSTPPGSTVLSTVPPAGLEGEPVEFARRLFEMTAPEAAVYVIRTMRSTRAPTNLRFAAAKHILEQAGTAKRDKQPADSQAAVLALAERMAALADRRRARADVVTVDQQPERVTEGNSPNGRPHGAGDGPLQGDNLAPSGGVAASGIAPSAGIRR